jgi:ankyrin repeat protein
MLNLLYYYGADPSILNTNNQSSLHIASASNRLSIVRELYNLTQISLLEIKDNHGQTPLSVTTHPDIISQLIEYGADISSLDTNHMNVLMSAVSTGQIAVVDRLLSAVNDKLMTIFDQVEKRNDRSIFLIAARTGSVDMCSLLLTHPYIRWDTLDKQRMNAFHIAARNNHSELIKFLCDHIRKSNKLTPMNSRSYSITITTDSNVPNIQQSLPILRLYIDAQNEDGKTPLHLASEQGHTLSVQVLLQYNADVLLPNYLGQLALHAAIQNGHGECVDLLVKACKKYLADFRSVLSRRQSPLITACQNGFADIVQVLLSEQIGVHDGMDFDNNKEDNPLEIAIKYRHTETVHVLLEHSHTEHWLMSIKSNGKHNHQTPLRDMIRYMPECAKHAFDRLIIKTTGVNFYGEEFERTVYKYKYIDDYFT